MKHLLLPLSLVVALMCSCGHGTAVATGDSERTDSQAVAMDSLAVAATLTFDALPEDTLMQRCLAQFVGQTLFFPDTDDEAAALPVYHGNLLGYLHDCARHKWLELRDATFGSDSEPSDDDEQATPEELAAQAMEDSVWLTAYQMDYRKVYESDSFVTWTAHCDFYVYATAHPSFGHFGQTYRKADGTLVGRELLKDADSPAFRRELKEALRRWIAEELGEQCDTDAQLKEFLFGENIDPNALPLPEHSPYLTSEGVALPYMENELTFSREPAVLVVPF